MSPQKDLAQTAAALLGARCSRVEPLHGGDLSEVLLLHLGDGRKVVAKSGPSPEAEARMLAELARARAPVPEVLAVCYRALVLGHVAGSGGLGAEGWGDLGQALRQVHDCKAAGNGWPEPYAFASLVIDNTPEPTWPAFWAKRRLLAHSQQLPPALAARLCNLAVELPEHLPGQATSLLHGDLWAGNILARNGRLAALIDPASYYGDGEVDIAMLHLFSTPGPAFAEGYGPLPSGATTRRAIYQLWPAIVHARLFGAGYNGLIDRLLTATGH
ncbi:fructosamine kinase family protein [Oceanicola sp. D3]|uniref:fructosamine kinase family protein n=1 Tax=Oceanicola sp. D3 TaxID=2587163 RepID=UPI00111F42B9|nr:fructosamine kinase family protein [Oceanicola sp. D3]QDC10724.1 fructosamine kinase family protein [Oceanicola sp. D3]